MTDFNPPINPTIGPAFRPFTPADLPAMQRIRAAAFEPVFRSFRAIVGAEIAALAFTHANAEQVKLLDDTCNDAYITGSGHQVLVVTLGDEIVGFVAFTVNAETRTGEIGLNAVHPEHAGNGIGTAMYEHVLARMKALGMALATVGTGATRATRPHDAPTRRRDSVRRSDRSTCTGCSELRHGASAPLAPRTIVVNAAARQGAPR